MKAKKLIIALIAIALLTTIAPTEITATPPPWAPAHGYRQHTRQIYFPQQNFYYDLNQGVYIYINGRNWTTSVVLPSRYKGIDLRLAPQVQLSIGSDRPYIYNHDHRAKYWNSKVQKEYHKKMEKERKKYYKSVSKAKKEYYKKQNKAAKKYHKNNEKRYK